ncbi:uncharacterized protein [Miscanthus floridulus]|uniref:uncharacterized protein n=1 Tax=Miscanthus floridulus TaxID=154761 RepID=UPI0034595A19
MLDPTIRNVRFKKVLIDGGSALNILFAEALTELGLTKDDLILVDSPFWGIVPRRVSQSLGQITLPVQFGPADHFHTEYVNFVADFDTAYHAILGRLALTKFMAVLHYVYMVLKIPTEQGILTLRANVSTSYDCEQEGIAIAKAIDLSTRMEVCITNSKNILEKEQAIPTQEPPWSVTKYKDTKEVELVIGDRSRMARIGAHLNPK